MGRLTKLIDVVKARMLSKGLDPVTGGLMPDPAPVSAHVRHRPQPSMFELVREAVRSESLRKQADDADIDTFEESIDFEVADDPFPQTVYERRGASTLKPGELSRRRRDSIRAAEAARRKAAGSAAETTSRQPRAPQRAPAAEEVDPEGE